LLSEFQRHAKKAKANKDKPGKESAVRKTRRSTTNADLDGALMPPAPVGSR
jgi:hypothetical protein